MTTEPWRYPRVISSFLVGPLTAGLVVALLLPGLAAAAYEEAKVDNAGRVTGIVRFSGTPPSPRHHEVTRDREVCGAEPKTSEALLVSPSKAIKNVVVYLEEVTQGKAFSTASVELDQHRCWFIPHVLLVRAGHPFTLVNSDGVLHNFRTPGTAANPALNKAQPKFKRRLQIQIENPDVIPVNCDVHEWMHAVLVVMGHPYYTLTDEAGTFALGDVPPGRYTLVLWHEVLGNQTRDIVVTASGEAKVSVEFKGK